MANLVTFVKKLWKDATSGGTPITAAELNRMEGGINDCATQINKLGIRNATRPRLSIQRPTALPILSMSRLHSCACKRQVGRRCSI